MAACVGASFAASAGAALLHKATSSVRLVQLSLRFLPANPCKKRVDPRGLEPLTSAMRERHEGLQEFSGACKTPANGSILMLVLFLAFQEIYSGCCTVAAHDQKDARGEWWPFSASLRGELRCVARTLPSSDAAPISRIMVCLDMLMSAVLSDAIYCATHRKKQRFCSVNIMH